MKITFLGTGTSQGIPVIACDCEVCLSKNEKDKRLRVSILIETKNNTLVIDSGPDFRTQMLREDVQDIDGILYTHEHKDHVAGLDDVRPFCFKHNKLFLFPRKAAASAPPLRDIADAPAGQDEGMLLNIVNGTRLLVIVHSRSTHPSTMQEASTSSSTTS